jgi:hypothetical protein
METTPVNCLRELRLNGHVLCTVHSPLLRLDDEYIHTVACVILPFPGQPRRHELRTSLLSLDAAADSPDASCTSGAREASDPWSWTPCTTGRRRRRLGARPWSWRPASVSDARPTDKTPLPRHSIRALALVAAYTRVTPSRRSSSSPCSAASGTTTPSAPLLSTPPARQRPPRLPRSCTSGPRR